MIFSIVILLLVGVIGYFYFVQGFFTGLLSAISAVLAASLAISYFEPMSAAMFQNKFVDSGNAIALITIFAVSFFALRLLFDKLVPGNIRLQSTVDSAGGAAMGVIVAIFATGIFALAAQSMPFGPSIMGQTRFKTNPVRAVTVPGSGQATDEQVTDELNSETLDPNDRQTLLLPVDDWTVGFVSFLSNGGSLAGSTPLSTVHPALLDEYFGQRIGIQPGASHVTPDPAGRPNVTVKLAYVLPQVAEGESEILDLRPGKSPLKIIKPMLKSEGANAIVAVRVFFGAGASDTDRMVRLSPASIRLCANGNNYTPLGTLDATGKLLVNKPDDPLIINVGDGDHGADVVFFVPRTEVLSGAPANPKAGAGAGGTSKFVPGAFLEVKRGTKIDLSDVQFVPPQSPDKTLNVLRKKGIAAPPAATSGMNSVVPAPTAELAVAETPFINDHIMMSSRLFSRVAVGLLDSDDFVAQFPSGVARVHNKSTLDQLQVTPSVNLRELATGSNALNELFVPAGMHMVQFVGTPPARTEDAWGWAEHLGEFSLQSAAGNSFKPAGAAAKVLKSQQPMMAAAYQTGGITPLLKPIADARPTDVWLLFNVDNGQPLKELDYQGKLLVPVNSRG